MSCGDVLGTRPNDEMKSWSSGVVEMMSSRDIVLEYLRVFIIERFYRLLDS